MSDSVRPHRRQPTRLPRPWNPPGKNTGVGCHFLLQCMKVKSESEVAQSCPTLTDPMDCSLPGSSIHGIFQARVLESGAIAFSDVHRGACKRGTESLKALGFHGWRPGYEDWPDLRHFPLHRKSRATRLFCTWLCRLPTRPWFSCYWHCHGETRGPLST